MVAQGYASAMPASIPVPGSSGAFTGKAKGAPMAAAKPAMASRGRAAPRMLGWGFAAAPPPPPAPPAQAKAPARPAPATPPREQAVDKEAKTDATYERAKDAAATPKKRARSEAAPIRTRAFAEETKPVLREEDFDVLAQEDPAAHEPVPHEEPSGAIGTFARLADADDVTEFGSGGGGAVPASTPMPSLGTLPGRVMLHRQGLLVLEVDVRFAFAWRLPASLVAITADGESALVSLRATGTTAAAQLQPGMRLRLVLELPEGMPLPERLELELDGRLLTITPIG
jgi:hypothetical protein